MENRSVEKTVRKPYGPPTLTVYGKVSDLTQHGRRGGGRGGRRGGRGRGGRGRGKGRGHGGSRS